MLCFPPFWSPMLPCLSRVQPVEITIKPPPTWTTGSEMPKKERMCVPIKYEPIRRKKQFTAIRQDSARRVLDEYSLVIARKMGLPPSGSTMGNSALRTRNKLFAASAMTSISAALAGFNLGGGGKELVPGSQ